MVNLFLDVNLRQANVRAVRAGVVTGLTDNENPITLSCRSGDIQQSSVAVCRVRRASNLFNPERPFFVQGLWSDSLSIPVKVTTGKVVNSIKRTGLGSHNGSCVAFRASTECSERENTQSLKRGCRFLFLWSAFFPFLRRGGWGRGSFSSTFGSLLGLGRT